MTFFQAPTTNPWPPTTWRLLISPPLDGASNMAIDEALLQALAAGDGLPTLRFYRWRPACLSLGYGQSWRDVDEAACADLGYTWVRRPTGGRAILHTDELTYSVILPHNEPRVAGDVVSSYRVLSGGLLAGLQQLGADVAQAEGDMPKNPLQGTACFDTPSHYEVTALGKKLVGSAQVRRLNVVLQHGTLPLHGDLTRIFASLNLSADEKGSLGRDLLNRAATLQEVLGRIVPFTEAAQAMAAGFAQALGVTLQPGDLSAAEHQLADSIRNEKYGADDWNKRR